jgi:CelD/BcsL family acetyltransferase involved in cellulose biosynthesis
MPSLPSSRRPERAELAASDASTKIELLDERRLEQAAGEWAELWRRCPGATPFQAPEWLLPWARRYAPGRAGAAALRRDGRLDGLAPVFTWRGAMLLAGTGPSDRADWLLAPEAEGLADRLLAALPTVPCGSFERIELRQLSPGSTLVSAAVPTGWADERGADEPCLVAPLGGEDGLGRATKSCRSNWRYAMRRIARDGGAVERLPEAEAAAGMADLARLHGLRWQARGEPGVLADPLLDGFLREAAPELARSGLLRLYRLRLGAETVAVLFALAGRRAHHYYLGGFDPRFGALGPLAALTGWAMGRAEGEGAAEFDFLRGGEPYKRRWGAEERPTIRRVLVRAHRAQKRNARPAAT